MDTVNWRKARQSNEHGGACVELAGFDGSVGVRDSKDPDGPKLVLDRSAFRALVDGLKRH